jgi:hypothetical protein
MAEYSIQTRLRERLAGELGSAVSEALAVRLAADRSDAVAAVLTLLDELEEVSGKAARAAIGALPELDRRAGMSHLIPWLDLGIALAESSGATTLKYFNDSPLILGLIEQPEARTAVLTIGLELADQDANVTLEFLRSAPHMLSVVPIHDLRPWLDLGIELVAVDVVVGLEYIRQIHRVASVLPVGEARNWLSFATTLVAPNTLGKPDYMATLEYMRTSPAILADIDDPEVRAKSLSVGALLAQRSPDAAVAWLAESPSLLRALPSPEWQLKVLQYGALLVEQDSVAAASYLRRCPEIVGLIGDGPHAGSRFETWFNTGMDVLAYSQEGARAYFTLASQKALSSVEQALSGVPLRQVARKIKLFVQGLCGTDVAIIAQSDSLTSPIPRATVSLDGRTIALPAVLRRYPTAEENERLYAIMAAHEAGHVEFGTYKMKLDRLADLIETVRGRYGQSSSAMPKTLAGLFELYPHPTLVRDLWTVVEDARVEFLLQAEYPGLRRELARHARESITPRDPAHGLTVKELLVDCLLRLSTGESAESAVPQAVLDEVSILWAMCQPLFKTTATAEEAIRLTHALYDKMEELLAPRGDMIEANRTEDQPKEPGSGQSESESMSDMYRPVVNWDYRGAMNPELVTTEQGLAEQAERQTVEDERMAGQGTGRGEQKANEAGALAGGRSSPSVVEELLAIEVEPPPIREWLAQGERTVRYPEWDHAIQDYRINWCQVVERPAEAGSDDGVGETLAAHRSAIQSLRRFFEGLRPPAFRRVAGQADGEELDLDAVVRRAAECRAGLDGGERVYIRREKRERNVAVAFLVDVSGSTSRQLESGRRVIDVEKESLVLLCEALEAVGDQYGLFAYSGQGRSSVDFLTVKDFDDRLGATTAHRLGGLAPRRQNRDGAAIRHASAKLMTREAKTRILILLNDGRPLDDEYKDDYALEDTRKALREARQQQIDPFCVTVDREADAYLRRLYGDVQFAVIDRAESLPAKLPRIYQRLTA